MQWWQRMPNSGAEPDQRAKLQTLVPLVIGGVCALSKHQAGTVHRHGAGCRSGRMDGVDDANSLSPRNGH